MHGYRISRRFILDVEGQGQETSEENLFVILSSIQVFVAA